jgi:neutral ceramidase
MGILQAGVSRINITPPIGIPLEGYPHRSRVSEGIHDELYAKTLVLDDGNEKIAIVTVDLVAVDARFTAKVRELTEAMTDLKGEHIMLAASHTHSGPTGFLPGYSHEITTFPSVEYRGPTQLYSPDIEAFRTVVARKIAGSIYQANNIKVKAKLGVGKSNIPRGKLCANRHNPEGLMDTELIVLRIDNLDGDPLAIVTNYTCHSTVLNASNLLVSADFTGLAMKTIESVVGHNTVAMFTNGAAGDISTRYSRREQTFMEVERLGKILAGEAIRILPNIETIPTVTLNGVSKVLKLPRKNWPSLKAAREAFKASKEKLNALKRSEAAEAEIRTAFVDFQGSRMTLIRAEKLKQSVKDNASTKKVSTEVQALRINDTILVGIPGELFVEIGMNIKKKAETENIFIVGYANDYISYIITPEAYRLDILEKFMTETTAEGANKIQKTALELISEVHK